MVDAEPPEPLTRIFFARPADQVAVDLLGNVVVSRLGGRTTAGRIVESEAYHGPDDPASHAARLRNGRVQVMFSEVGIAYVYRSYGIHAMLNVVAHAAGEVGAVLIRAVEPILGVDVMRDRRGDVRDRQLSAGPGNLCQAMGITLDEHGIDLTSQGSLWIGAGRRVEVIHVSPRIGISRGVEAPLRYFLAGSPYVSVHRRGVPLSDSYAVLP